MAISKILVKRFQNYDSKSSLGSRLRVKRIAPLLDMIKDVFSEYGSVSIIDIGERENYWKVVPMELLDKYNVSITIVNVPGSQTQEPNGRFNFIETDGGNMDCFESRAFHIAHSNSVIEHVGDWGHMLQFSREISRVSQKYFVQTPNY